MKSSEKEFIAEAEDILEEAGRLLLEVQDTHVEGVNPDTVNALFRALHTLKGLSGLFGHHGITEVSHALESLLDDIRLGKLEITGDVVSFLFKNLDVLKSMVEGLGEHGEADARLYLEEIEAFRKSLEGKTEAQSLEGIVDESVLKTLSEYEEHRLKANLREGKGIYMVKSVFSFGDFETSLDSLTKAVRHLGELVSTLPTSADIPPDSIGFNIMFASSEPSEKIKTALKYDVAEIAAPRRKEGTTAAVRSVEASLRTTASTVRVDIEKLDRILNTIGELNLAKGAIKRIGEEMTEVYGRNELVVDMHKITHTFDRRLSELQDQVLEIRMVPIGQIFGRLSQVVRRYSREVGKQMEFVMFGEDTEIDKYIAEEIIDPLVHVVRNAIDHGIEPEEERKRKGKKPLGSVVLKAFQRGNHVVIEVNDDGRGIDLERVRRKAVEKGIIEEGDSLQRRELLELIFMPGFSTKDIVSEVSGRGVGMDIVRDKLSAIGGFSDVETEEGRGTTITLTLPITLAILKALLVRVGQERLALPLTSISETHVIERSELQTIEGREVYNLRGDMLPVARVNEVFRLPTSVSDRSFAVIVGFGERKMGLLVDELFGQHEIVIKSLGMYFKGLRGFAGAAEIGRHEVILVLDVESLIEEALTRQKAGRYV